MLSRARRQIYRVGNLNYTFDCPRKQHFKRQHHLSEASASPQHSSDDSEFQSENATRSIVIAILNLSRALSLNELNCNVHSLQLFMDLATSGLAL